MKMIPKTKALLLANKAESISEVTVAFMVMTIVMTLFAQGMKFANTAERYAIDRSRDSDNAMKDMLDTAINGTGKANAGPVSYEQLNNIPADRPKLLKLRMYSVNGEGGGDFFVYYVYDANLS